MRMRVIIGDAVSAKDWLQAVADIAIVMLPTMEEYGIATTADIDCATIAERLVHEVTSNGSMVIGRAEVGAWRLVASVIGKDLGGGNAERSLSPINCQ